MEPLPAAVAILRKEYSLRALRKADLAPDPFAQFALWFDEAVKAVVTDPNAMTLATATAAGQPSARTVLLKGFDADGFTFFTNYGSRKSRELSENPHAALVFFWPELERQVCLTGQVEKVDSKTSDEYFDSRPRGSQLGAWVSSQSEVAEHREALEQRLAEYEARFRDGPVARPPNWGGYRLRPDMIEFWQGRPSRLHDRFRYARSAGGWVVDRLWP